MQAVAEMNGKELNGRVLYVGRAQKRLERQSELKRKFELIKQERLNRYQVNTWLFEHKAWHLDFDMLMSNSKLLNMMMPLFIYLVI